MREGGVVPADGAFAVGRVDGAHLVGDAGVGLERGEPVGEPGGHEQLVAELRGQGDGDVLAERGGPAADVDGDVEDRAVDDADELVLRVRGSW